MQVLGILIELRGEGAANAGIYRHTCRSRASSIFVPHAPYKVTPVPSPSQPPPQRRKYPGFLEDSGGSALAGAVAAAVLASTR